MQEVRQTWFKLLPYWRATNANVKWQLLIFDAVVRSKLLYGLETIHLTDAMLKKVDAFQLRCLRKILKVPSTFIDRRNTNREVLNRCTALAYPNRGDRREFEFFSNRISVGNLNYWVMYSGLATTILCAKFLSSPIVQSEFLMGKNESVARDKTGCITPKNILLNIF